MGNYEQYIREVISKACEACFASFYSIEHAKT